MINLSNIAGLGAAALLGATASAAGTSFAQSSGAAPDAPPKAAIARYELGPDPSFSDVRDRLAGQGFEARKVEYDDGRIEVKGLNADGRCMEVYFHPGTGKELRREREDNCHVRGRKVSGSDDLWGDDDFDDRGDDWFDD